MRGQGAGKAMVALCVLGPVFLASAAAAQVATKGTREVTVRTVA